MNDIIFLLTLYVDHNDRLENISINIDYMNRLGYSNLYVVEYGEKNSLCQEYVNKCYKYEFIKSDEYWNRPRILNNMAKKCSSDMISILDVDILLTPEQLYNGCKLLKEQYADFVLPYDGRYLEIPREILPKFRLTNDLHSISNLCNERFDINNYIGVGGCMMFNRESYIKGGMENESFMGWGCEDEEIYERFFKLGYNVVHLKNCGPIHHMSHYRHNFDSSDAPWYKDHVKIRNSIKDMSYCELKNTVKKWGWVK
jgi:predicted glycosyltransferase involved in capsule biosynthesis